MQCTQLHSFEVSSSCVKLQGDSPHFFPTFYMLAMPRTRHPHFDLPTVLAIVTLHMKLPSVPGDKYNADVQLWMSNMKSF